MSESSPLEAPSPPLSPVSSSPPLSPPRRPLDDAPPPPRVPSPPPPPRQSTSRGPPPPRPPYVGEAEQRVPHARATYSRSPSRQYERYIESPEWADALHRYHDGRRPVSRDRGERHHSFDREYTPDVSSSHERHYPSNAYSRSSSRHHERYGELPERGDRLDRYHSAPRSLPTERLERRHSSDRNHTPDVPASYVRHASRARSRLREVHAADETDEESSSETEDSAIKYNRIIAAAMARQRSDGLRPSLPAPPSVLELMAPPRHDPEDMYERRSRASSGSGRRFQSILEAPQELPMLTNEAHNPSDESDAAVDARNPEIRQGETEGDEGTERDSESGTGSDTSGERTSAVGSEIGDVDASRDQEPVGSARSSQAESRSHASDAEMTDAESEADSTPASINAEAVNDVEFVSEAEKAVPQEEAAAPNRESDPDDALAAAYDNPTPETLSEGNVSRASSMASDPEGAADSDEAADIAGKDSSEAVEDETYAGEEGEVAEPAVADQGDASGLDDEGGETPAEVVQAEATAPDPQEAAEEGEPALTTPVEESSPIPSESEADPAEESDRVEDGGAEASEPEVIDDDQPDLDPEDQAAVSAPVSPKGKGRMPSNADEKRTGEAETTDSPFALTEDPFAAAPRDEYDDDRSGVHFTNPWSGEAHVDVQYTTHEQPTTWAATEPPHGFSADEYVEFSRLHYEKYGVLPSAMADPREFGPLVEEPESLYGDQDGYHRYRRHRYHSSQYADTVDSDHSGLTRQDTAASMPHPPTPHGTGSHSVRHREQGEQRGEHRHKKRSGHRSDSLSIPPDQVASPSAADRIVVDGIEVAESGKPLTPERQRHHSHSKSHRSHRSDTGHGFSLFSGSSESKSRRRHRDRDDQSPTPESREAKEQRRRERRLRRETSENVQPSSEPPGEAEAPATGADEIIVVEEDQPDPGPEQTQDDGLPEDPEADDQTEERGQQEQETSEIRSAHGSASSSRHHRSRHSERPDGDSSRQHRSSKHKQHDTDSSRHSGRLREDPPSSSKSRSSKDTHDKSSKSGGSSLAKGLKSFLAPSQGSSRTRTSSGSTSQPSSSKKPSSRSKEGAGESERSHKHHKHRH